jgi:hypothetical protein
MRVSYVFSLGDELAGIELRHDALQDLIYDGGQDSFIKVLAELAEYGR